MAKVYVRPSPSWLVSSSQKNMMVKNLRGRACSGTAGVGVCLTYSSCLEVWQVWLQSNDIFLAPSRSDKLNTQLIQAKVEENGSSELVSSVFCGGFVVAEVRWTCHRHPRVWLEGQVALSRHVLSLWSSAVECDR